MRFTSRVISHLCVTLYNNDVDRSIHQAAGAEFLHCIITYGRYIKSRTVGYWATTESMLNICHSPDVQIVLCSLVAQQYCLPILLHGLQACPLNQTNLRSLVFSVNRFFEKLFNTSDIQTVAECHYHIMASDGIGQAIIFLSCSFFYLSSFSSPNLNRRRLDVCHTSTHVTALV